MRPFFLLLLVIFAASALAVAPAPATTSPAAGSKPPVGQDRVISKRHVLFFKGKTSAASAQDLAVVKASTPALALAACLRVPKCAGWMAAPSVTDQVFLKGKAEIEAFGGWTDTPALDDNDDGGTGLFVLKPDRCCAGWPQPSTTAAAPTAATPPGDDGSGMPSGGGMSLEPQSAGVRRATAPAASAPTPSATKPLAHSETGRGGRGDRYFSTLDFKSLLTTAANGTSFDISDIMSQVRVAESSARRYKDAVLHATAVQKRQDIEIAQERSQLAQERSSLNHEGDASSEKERRALRTQVQKERERAWTAWKASQAAERRIMRDAQQLRRWEQAAADQAKAGAKAANDLQTTRMNTAAEMARAVAREQDLARDAAKTLDEARAAAKEHLTALSKVVASGPAGGGGDGSANATGALAASIGVSLAFLDEGLSQSRTADALLEAAQRLFDRAQAEREKLVKAHRAGQLQAVAATQHESAQRLAAQASALRKKAAALREAHAQKKAKEQERERSMALRLNGFERGIISGFPHPAAGGGKGGGEGGGGGGERDASHRRPMPHEPSGVDAQTNPASSRASDAADQARFLTARAAELKQKARELRERARRARSGQEARRFAAPGKTSVRAAARPQLIPRSQYENNY